MYVKMVPYFKNDPVGMAMSHSQLEGEQSDNGYCITPHHWEEERYKLGRGYSYSCMEILGAFEEAA